MIGAPSLIERTLACRIESLSKLNIDSGMMLAGMRDNGHMLTLGYAHTYQNNQSNTYDPKHHRRQSFDQRGQGHESEEAEQSLASPMEIDNLYTLPMRLP